MHSLMLSIPFGTHPSVEYVIILPVTFYSVDPAEAMETFRG